jgi:hypothetical protein
MTIRWPRFNLYLRLALALTLALASGCMSPEEQAKRHPAKISIHLETRPDGTNLNEAVPIYRKEPVMVNVERIAFVNELNVADAKVIDVVGGFALRLQFDRQGTWLLEEKSTASASKRFAIFCKFGPNLRISRWLAAPVISGRISDGVLTFTPDATREEAEVIAQGLSNVGREVSKKTQW